MTRSSGCIKAPWRARLNLASFPVTVVLFIWFCVVHSSLACAPSISLVLYMVVTFLDLNLPLICCTRLTWLRCFSLWPEFFSSGNFWVSFSSANALARDSCYFFLVSGAF